MLPVSTPGQGGVCDTMRAGLGPSHSFPTKKFVLSFVNMNDLIRQVDAVDREVTAQMEQGDKFHKQTWYLHGIFKLLVIFVKHAVTKR